MGRCRRPAAAAVALVLSFAAVACVPQAPGPAAGSAAPPVAPAPPPASTWQDQMLAAVNAQRAAAGAPSLVMCGRLVLAAQLHSQDQAATNTMSHTGSNGSTLSSRMAAIGYTGWTALGENVAAGYGSVDSVMSGWMNSSGHRANILNPNFTHAGFGRADSSRGTPYWTQNFGRSGTC